MALPIAPAGATPPLAVEFEVPTTFAGGTFTATGPAVDDGLMCDVGVTEDLQVKASGFQSGTRVNLQVLKLFTCDDGSGDFLVKLQVRLVFGDEGPPTSNNFNWYIMGGTGDYEDLHGTGKGVGLYDVCGPACDVFDVYTGKLHID